MPWNLLITAIASTVPTLLPELMGLYNKERSGTLVTPEEWSEFETKYLSATSEQRLLAIARKIA